MMSTNNKWYEDWQAQKHVELFDFRSVLSDTDLIRDYERYNDVLLLNERLKKTKRSTALLEVGCATGEFFRYLRLKYPQVGYCGIDISEPALECARSKYPEASFLSNTPTDTGDLVNGPGFDGEPAFLYSKDVVLHQTDPFLFTKRLIETATHTVVMRLRTRDNGPTEFDPELSCQYHYSGWMPYIVLNVDEIVEHVRAVQPAAELVIRRHHIVLGGLHNRYLPKDCYLTETGTAETAVGVFIETDYPGRITIEDVPENAPAYTWRHLSRSALRRVKSAMMRRRL
jgi:SAM-dependent methyltransferase